MMHSKLYSGGSAKIKHHDIFMHSLIVQSFQENGIKVTDPLMFLSLPN